MNKKIVKLFVFLALFVFASCKSAPVIPDDATAVQLIQMGQDAQSVLNYDGAQAYYMAVIQRYGMDTSTYIEATYELGHLAMQRHQYEKAYYYFKEILDIFENAEFGTVPQAYKKLALMGMANIPEKRIPKEPIAESEPVETEEATQETDTEETAVEVQEPTEITTEDTPQESTEIPQ